MKKENHLLNVLRYCDLAISELIAQFVHDKRKRPLFHKLFGKYQCCGEGMCVAFRRVLKSPNSKISYEYEYTFTQYLRKYEPINHYRSYWFKLDKAGYKKRLEIMRKVKSDITNDIITNFPRKRAEKVV